MNVNNYCDPVFPLLSHPSTYRSRRYHASLKELKKGRAPVFEATGPGCIKTMWFCIANIVEKPETVRIEIYADDDDTPKVDMHLFHFFGIFLDRYPYRVDCAAFQVLPRYIGPRAASGFGFTSFIPIPFSKSCIVYLRNNDDSPVYGGVYADWHQYPEGTALTPYRLHANYHGEFPAEHRSLFPMADITGAGFVAGIFKGIRQRNYRDMIYHTGGQVWLMDGETEPNAIHGDNEEDDFGLHWGYQETMTPLIGCPYHNHKEMFDQDGVIYRFFSNDAIQFKNSLYLASQARSDDTETTVYYYLEDGAALSTPAFEFLPDWQVIGPYPCPDYETFAQGEQPENSPDIWDREFEKEGLRKGAITAKHGWVNMWPVCISGKSIEASSPECRGNTCAYARTVIAAEKARERIFRITFCDYMTVWLNGERIGAHKHGYELSPEDIVLKLSAGKNELLVKTSHADMGESYQKDLWAFNCKLL